MPQNDAPKSVNIDTICTSLHVNYLNWIAKLLKTVQIAQIQAYSIECTPCFPKNWVLDIKSSQDNFVGIKTLSRLFDFRLMALNRSSLFKVT